MSVHFCARVNGPREVADHPELRPEVKRAILATWASDAYAVRSHPALRCPPELNAPIPIDEVMNALKALDQVSAAA